MQQLFYNLTNRSAEKELCGREQLQTEELKFLCSICVTHCCYLSSCQFLEKICEALFWSKMW